MSFQARGGLHEFLVEFEVNVPDGTPESELLDRERAMSSGGLPVPRLSPVYRLDANLGQARDVGETAGGRRRIVPLAGGRSRGRS